MQIRCRYHWLSLHLAADGGRLTKGRRLLKSTYPRSTALEPPDELRARTLNGSEVKCWRRSVSLHLADLFADVNYLPLFALDQQRVYPILIAAVDRIKDQ